MPPKKKGQGMLKGFRSALSGRQTGKSKTSADKQRRAKPPGKRKSPSGGHYYERRRNRSDRSARTRL